MVFGPFLFLAILVVLLGLLPSFAWLTFFLTEDEERPEPKPLIAYTFLAGVFITVFVLQIQSLVNAGFIRFSINTYGLTAFFVLTATEEIAKFAAAYWIIRNRRDFDEPMDAMVYMITAALGFAAVENIALVIHNRSAFFPSVTALEITVLRFIGATLLHALTSGIVGFYWGKAINQGRRLRGAIMKGLLIATALHTLFNYLIIKLDTIFIPVAVLIVAAAFVLKDFAILKKSNLTT